MINVPSAVNRGQLAPSAKASGNDDRDLPTGFDRMLAGELGEDDGATTHDGAEHAVASSDRPAAIGAPSGRQPGGDPPRLASAPLLAVIIEGAPAATSVGPGKPDHAISEGADGPAVAAPATPAPPVAASTAPDVAAPASTATVVATTIALGGGPVLSVAAADGLTPAADEIVAPGRTDDGEAVPTDVRRGDERRTQDGHFDEVTAEIAGLSVVTGTAPSRLIPLVAAPHKDNAAGAAASETSVRTGKSVLASLEAGVSAGARAASETGVSPDDKLKPTKADDLSSGTSTVDLPTNVPARLGAHHAGPLPFEATPGNPVAALTPPLSAPSARSGGCEMDAAALQHVARLYAPHDGTVPSGGASGFARLGTIGQDTGVALARGVADGRDHVALRLDPPDLGRIDVQLSFAQDGGLRAVVASDNRAALDLLRRDLDQLQRALADAGVRADAQSFHFSERQSDGRQRWDAPIPHDQRYAAPADPATDRPAAGPTSRRLRSSGLIDVFA